MSGIKSVTCLILVFAVSGGFCDTLTFRNGDRLSGRFVRLTEGRIEFESEVAGVIEVDSSNVLAISTNEPAAVHFKDGSVEKGVLRGGEKGLWVVGRREAAVLEISAINPPPKEKPRFKGDITIGYDSSHGNTQNEKTSARVNILRRREKDRTKGDFEYFQSRERDPDTDKDKTTEDSWRLRGKYDYFLTKKKYVFTNASYETDKVAELDYRTIFGGGMGYQWLESEKTNFSTEVGLAVLRESFEDRTNNNSELSLQAGYHFDRQINDKSKFIQDLTFYPAVDDFSDYYLTSSTEIRNHVTKNLFMNFRLIFDYDASPAEDSTSTDVKYIFGAGMSF